MAQARIKAISQPTLSLTMSERAQALTLAISSASIDAARAVAHCTTVAWWDRLTRQDGAQPGALPLAKCPVVLSVLDPRIQTDAQAYGIELARLSVKNAVAALGDLYSHGLPGEHRAATGVYYTPPRLVLHLLDKATTAGMDWRSGRALSPACGGGQFLVDAARRMVETMAGADPAIVLASIGARLRGWDIDPFSAWLAHVAVEATLLPQALASGKRLAPVTEHRNSLLDSWEGHEGTWNLVMENPAFGKVKDTADIRARFGRSLYGHPNVYGLFMDLGVHLAKPEGGIVAYLTPTSFLGGEYFKALRCTLARVAPPVSIDLVESRKDVFEDVLQEVALTVLRRGEPRAGGAACSIVHVEPQALRIEDAGSLALPAVATEPWLMPRRPADIPLVAAMQHMPMRLADYGYRVRTGPLVWNRHRIRLHDKHAKGRVPVVWAESVTQAGHFALKADKANHCAFYEPMSSTDPNLVRETCLLLQRTTAKEQHRRLIGAVMPVTVITAHRAVAVENHLNMVVATSSKPSVPLKALARFFASETADRVMRCINASVAISATELEAMPLPAAGGLVSAMAAADPEAELRLLYGV